MQHVSAMLTVIVGIKKNHSSIDLVDTVLTALVIYEENKLMYLAKAS